MTQLPNAGTHVGKVNGSIVIYEAESGALCAAIPVALANSEVAWHGKHTITIVKKDGEVQGRALQTLKEVFGWDGIDPFWLTEQDFSAVEFELVCEHEEFTPEGKDEPVLTFKIKWMNPLGGGSRMPEAADRKSILAKYGNKFRALSGGTKPAATPAKTSAPAKTAKAEAQDELPAAAPAKAPPGKKAPAKAPPKTQTAGGQPPTATMEEAWAALQAANANLNEDQQGELWYNKIEELFPGKTNDDLSIQNFGTLKVALETAS